MKKKVLQNIEVEVDFCNICGKEIPDGDVKGLEGVGYISGAAKRIKIVRGLFKTENFDAHEQCVNKVTREAFRKYIKKLTP